MTPDMNCSNNEFDRRKPISSFDVSSNEKLKEPFIWINTQPLRINNH